MHMPELQTPIPKILTPTELQGEESNPTATKVVIFDFDEVLGSRDEEGTPDSAYDDNPNFVLELFLIGEEELALQLRELKGKGYALCIATRKNKEGAEEIVPFLETNGIANLFDFIVYESSKDSKERHSQGGVDDNKKLMLELCKAYYPSATQEMHFIDDTQANVAMAKALNIQGHFMPVDNVRGTKEAKNAALLNIISEIKNRPSQTVSISSGSTSHVNKNSGLGNDQVVATFFNAYNQQGCYHIKSFWHDKHQQQTAVMDIIKHARGDNGSWWNGWLPSYFSGGRTREVLKSLNVTDDEINAYREQAIINKLSPTIDLCR